MRTNTELGRDVLHISDEENIGVEGRMMVGGIRF